MGIAWPDRATGGRRGMCTVDEKESKRAGFGGGFVAGHAGLAPEVVGANREKSLPRRNSRASFEIPPSLDSFLLPFTSGSRVVHGEIQGLDIANLSTLLNGKTHGSRDLFRV